MRMPHFSLMRRLGRWIMRRTARPGLAVADWMLARFAPYVSAWERINAPIPGVAMGWPDDDAINRYLAGPSTVPVADLDDIRTWLQSCAYERTHEFRAQAAWESLPFVFEYVKRGDCMDHALWAWRKLRELGIDADFVVGWTGPPGVGHRHAWVILGQGSDRLLFETVEKVRPRMLRPLSDRETYIPEFGVDRHGRRFAFGGLAHLVRAQRSASGARTA